MRTYLLLDQSLDHGNFLEQIPAELYSDSKSVPVSYEGGRALESIKIKDAGSWRAFFMNADNKGPYKVAFQAEGNLNGHYESIVRHMKNPRDAIAVVSDLETAKRFQTLGATVIASKIKEKTLEKRV